MIEIQIIWKSKGQEYKIGLFQFGDEKTRAVVEKLNELTENPMDVEKLLGSWPLGEQEVVK